MQSFQPYGVRRGEKLKFHLLLVFLPSLLVAGLTCVFSYLLITEHTAISRLLLFAILELLILSAFLYLLWWPVILIIWNKGPVVEYGTLFIRNAVLIWSAVIWLPEEILEGLFDVKSFSTLYQVGSWAVFVVLLVFTMLHAWITPYRDIRGVEPGQPRPRNAKMRWIWYDVIALFMTFFFVSAILFYMLAATDFQKSTLFPSKVINSAFGELQPIDQDSAPVIAVSGRIHSMALVSSSSSVLVQGFQPTATALNLMMLACAALLMGILLFLIPSLSMRIMQAVLVVLTFHEHDIKPVFYKAHRYLFHFYKAMLFKYPIPLLGSLLLTFVMLGIPILFYEIGAESALNILFLNADVAIFGLIVGYAWLGLTALSAVNPDETYGEYFDRQLTNSIMVIQNHIVFVGYGSLGKRVVERQVGDMWRDRARRKRLFEETVTPDLRLEYLSREAIIVEKTSVDIIYASQNKLLEQYGVISPFRFRASRLERLQTNQQQEIAEEPRVLVPTIVGDARDPFISSRVNLERARMIISMIPDERGIQELFEHVCCYKHELKDNKQSLNAILCVNRSDQISYLTYRSRHRRIVLVYPKFNQGLTLGQRLWATMLKVRSIRVPASKKDEDWWPRVLIAGNNKSNHYMLETLWPNLTGLPEKTLGKLAENFAAIFTFSGREYYAPALRKRRLKVKPSRKKTVFDREWLATLQSNSRDVTARLKNIPKEIVIPACIINDVDIISLQACFDEHKPDILIINHEDVEKSLLLLSRSVRALERLKSQHGAEFRLPFILLSATTGNDWELLSLGDVSRYYDSLCRTYDEDIGKDLSYPGHAVFNHTERQVIGESISDLNADAEEIIMGSSRSLGNEQNRDFVEINVCTLNRPGALASYIAQLARLRFKHSDIEEYWQSEHPAHVPSFQYLRDIILDPGGKMFTLTGYATLAPMEPHQDEDLNGVSIIRMFSNNGENYRETQFDIDRAQDFHSRVWEDPDVRQKAREHHQARLKRSDYQPPLPPGVPEVIDRISKRKQQIGNTPEAYFRAMLDPQPDGQSGPLSCPGMANCRIAAFQDFISSSNSQRIQRYLQGKPGADPEIPERILHTHNYYCCPENIISIDRLQKVIPEPGSRYARIFLCCRGYRDFGMMALVLNHLVFRRYKKPIASRNKNDRWVIDIQYLKDETCHNRFFSLNRLFGTIIKRPDWLKLDFSEPPLHLFRILPIGTIESARMWYRYSVALFNFLRESFPNSTFRYEWINQSRTSRTLEDTPEFKDKKRPEFPVVFIIKRILDKAKPEDESLCHLCHVQPGEFDCRSLRAWV